MGIEPIKPGFKGGAARLSPSERHHFNSRRPLNSPENSPDALVLTATLLCLIIDTSLGKKTKSVIDPTRYLNRIQATTVTQRLLQYSIASWPIAHHIIAVTQALMQKESQSPVSIKKPTIIAYTPCSVSLAGNPLLQHLPKCRRFRADNPDD